MQLWELIVEASSPINEAKSPAEQAHDLGLVHVGWGYWAKDGDETGTPVAKTVNGKLVQLGDDDAETAKTHVDQLQGDDETSAEIDHHSIELGDLATAALDKLTDQAAEHTGIDAYEWSSALRSAIAISIIKGAPAELGNFGASIDPDQAEALQEFLSYLATTKTKLARAVAIAEKMRILKQRIYKKKAEKALALAKEKKAQEEQAEKEKEAAKAAMTPEPETPDTGNELTPDAVISLLGLNPKLANDAGFVGLIQKLDKAKSGAAVNYIAQLLKGQHSQVKTPQFITQQQWKQLHKHLKDLKGGIKVGAANPGKKKGTAVVTPEPTAQPAYPNDLVTQYKTWISGLPTNEFDKMYSVWTDFQLQTGATITSVGGPVAQGEIIMAMHNAVFSHNYDDLNNLVNKSLSQEQVDSLTAIAKKHEEPTTTAPTEDDAPDASWFEALPDDEVELINHIFTNSFGENHKFGPHGLNNVMMAIKNSLDSLSPTPVWELESAGIIDTDQALALRKNVVEAIKNIEDAQSEKTSVANEKESWLPTDYDSWTEPTKEAVNHAWDTLQADYWEANGKDIELNDMQKTKLFVGLEMAFNASSEGAVGTYIGNLQNYGLIPHTISNSIKKVIDKKRNELKAQTTPEPQQTNVSPEDIQHMNDYAQDTVHGMFGNGTLSLGIKGNIATMLNSAIKSNTTDGLDDYLSDLVKKGVITSDDAKNLNWSAKNYLAFKKSQDEKNAQAAPSTPESTPESSNPLADAQIPAGAVNGLQKSLNGWAKGDPKKILPWIIKKVKEDPKKTVNLKWQAMELVKNHGIPLSEVPDEVVPYEMKDVVNAAKAEPSATTSSSEPASTDDTTPSANDEQKVSLNNTETLLQNWITNQGGIDQAIQAAQAKITKVKNKALKDHWQDVVDDLNNIKSGVASFAMGSHVGDNPEQFAEDMIKSDGDWEAAYSNAKSSLHLAQTHGNAPDVEFWTNVVNHLEVVQDDMNGVPSEIPEVPEDPTPEATPGPDATSTLDATDANGIVTGTLMDMGFKMDHLTPEDQQKLFDAAAKALQSPTEFGVIHAFLPLKGIIDEKYLDGIKDNILAVLDKEGNLDKTPGAFKKYFDYDEMFDKMEKGEFSSKGGMDSSTPEQKQKFKTFLANVSPEDKEKLRKAMEVGLSFTGADGGKKAQEYYKQNLVGQIPGFDDDVFAVWRRALRGFHDELKGAEEFEQQKKAEAIKKKAEEEKAKKAAEELQKTLAAISSGDSAQAIKSIASSVGIGTLSPDQQKLLLVGIHDALKAPSSQAAFDKLNTLVGHNAYSGGMHYGAKVALPNDKITLLRQLVATVWAEKADPYMPTNEPKVNTPVETRVQHVLQQWKDEYGTGISSVSNKNSGKVQSKETERDMLLAALKQALAEPDPSKVNSHLNSLLLTGTSLSDEQVAQLRQLVQQERQNPASLQGKTLPSPGKTSSATKPAVFDGPKLSGGTTGLTKSPAYKQKSAYYKFPEAKKKEIHDDIYKAVSSGFNKSSPKSKAGFVDNLQNKLIAHGMDSKLARNTALWVAREYAEDGQLAQAAKKSAASSHTSDFAVHQIPLPTATEEQKARQIAESLPPTFAALKTEYVSKEHVRVHNSHAIVWNDKNGNGHHHNQADVDAKKQDAWRAANLSPEDLNKFNLAADDWQGGGQWTNPNLQRKAVNDIMTRTIEGPPPQYAEVDTYVERGMAMTMADFEDFIKVFEVGKKTFFGPSGFSANRETCASFYGSNTFSYSDHVKVLMRVRPPKSGKMKAARVHARSSHQHFGGEQEIVVGTSNNFRCVAVTKHLVQNGGQWRMAYEIELQYDESDLNESVANNAVGFDVSHWKGYSRNSVKMLLKWMNCGINRIPKQ